VVALEAIRNVVTAEVRNLEAIMTSKFKRLFDRTPDGTPRRWNSVDEVHNEWKNAKIEAEKAIDLFSIVRLNDKYKGVSLYKQEPSGNVSQVDDIPHLPEEVVVLPPSEGIKVLQRFREHADNAYKIAISEAERAATTSVPLYVWLLLALGWNEIWWLLEYMLFNPIGFLLAVFLALAAYFVYSTGTWPFVKNFALRILKHVEASAKARVGQYFHSPFQQQSSESKKDK